MTMLELGFSHNIISIQIFVFLPLIVNKNGHFYVKNVMKQIS